jgi:hypothetical protein
MIARMVFDAFTPAKKNDFRGNYTGFIILLREGQFIRRQLKLPVKGNQYRPKSPPKRMILAFLHVNKLILLPLSVAKCAFGKLVSVSTATFSHFFAVLSVSFLILWAIFSTEYAFSLIVSVRLVYVTVRSEALLTVKVIILT